MKLIKIVLISAVMISVTSVAVYADKDANGVEVPKPPADMFDSSGTVASNTYMDQKVSSWASDDVNWMVSKNLVPENLRGDYQKDITREEFASLVVSTLNYVAPEMKKEYWAYSENRFADSDNEDVYRAYTIGVVNGVSDTEFRPKYSIARQEAAVMMSNFLKSIHAPNLSAREVEYVDKLALADWAKESVNITGNAKIFQGSDQGFRAYDHYTREQSIVTMRRLVNYVGRVEGFSFRGKIFVTFKDMWRQDKPGESEMQGYIKPVVGVNWVRLGEPKWADEEMEDYTERLSSNFSQETIEKISNGSKKEVDGNYTIETGLTNCMIRISWKA